MDGGILKIPSWLTDTSDDALLKSIFQLPKVGQDAAQLIKRGANQESVTALQKLDLSEYNMVYTVTGSSATGTELLSAIAEKIGVSAEAVQLQEKLVDDEENQVRFTVDPSAMTEQISAKIQEMIQDMPGVTFVGGEATAVKLTKEQVAVALQMAANGVGDDDVAAATTWLQEKISGGGVAGLEAAVSEVLLKDAAQLIKQAEMHPMAALKALDLSELKEYGVMLTEDQAAAALRMAANGVADGDVTAAMGWLQEKLSNGGVDALQTAVSEVLSG